MPDHSSDRPFDLVLFGATGFTGGLTAEYLAANFPADARWAIAGRNPAKLQAVREHLAVINPAAASVEVLVADTSDPDSLRAVAESARVVVTTVGPYLKHGEPLVAACAAAGTDYLDLTGEPEFVDRTYVAYHRTAIDTGARIVHACGFDSIPHDLGAFYTVKHLPVGVPATVRGVVRTNAMISGGTLHSGLGQFTQARQMRRAAAERMRAEPQSSKARARVKSGLPHRDRHLGLWLMPLPTIDPQIVKRSALSRTEYGPKFTYSHYVGFRNPMTLTAAVLAILSLGAAVQVPPVRRLIGRAIPQGEGPSQARRDRSWFTVDFIGEGGGRRVHTQAKGGDPGYGETSKMLAEAAMCLAFDDNPPTSGQVTTAEAMGDLLLQRLIAAGISFTVLNSSANTAGERLM